MHSVPFAEERKEISDTPPNSIHSHHAQNMDIIFLACQNPSVYQMEMVA
jgi:hypothetical protein